MIKFSIRGENIEVTEAIRDYVESKLTKIEKYFVVEQEIDARVNLKVYREKTAKVEVTIPLGSVTLRAEDVSQDMYGSIDLVVDKIERQIRKNKTKIAKKHREKMSTSQVFTSEFEAEQAEETPEIKVVRTKNVTLKPMDVEEARLQMELLGHDFFIYTDAEDGATNVLYRREDGDLGLIEAK
ncbi:ribosome-associated translation inhibitor RaiA [Streptococcus equi subsp. zooepidemicus]|uniref:Ribosome hibernation promoting factor n=3 Tax=Streptococcus equi subsp. zooepidemicus TaxID=40041 RepID=B4U4G1_STREM|nr:ribosome-associated translation inhibitor RaiA [Streptococcus equi]KIS16609.1 ribosome-associated factor Y [Streptococcus equi subsp. zooepidemicus Sz4is]ACG62878.1 ribosomal subunit interface protein [Streptococcus equi subsp. zooepidemicus MGCS10565]EQB23209.1 ribosome-associated factor Y [Streptococcus equi subsp. zooepidemicus SzS31A1]KIS04832.1 ribosome-associated factor Y [Streptococcus equi subsp. zooepidemicus Sz12is]MCD3385595.1 ribosome-associated translation inhibitor RaiA [Strep